MDYGWYDDLDDEEMGTGGTGALNDTIESHRSNQRQQKGKFPGDYCQWIEEPNYSGRDNKQFIMPPPSARMSHSQSLQNISVNLEDKITVRDSKVPGNLMLNESIITVNHDGFRANIMTEDLLTDKGIDKQFVNFDTEVKSISEMPDGENKNSE